MYRCVEWSEEVDGNRTPRYSLRYMNSSQNQQSAPPSLTEQRSNFLYVIQSFLTFLLNMRSSYLWPAVAGAWPLNRVLRNVYKLPEPDLTNHCWIQRSPSKWISSNGLTTFWTVPCLHVMSAGVGSSTPWLDKEVENKWMNLPHVCLKKQRKLGHKEAQILKSHNVKHEDKCMQMNKAAVFAYCETSMTSQTCSLNGF